MLKVTVEQGVPTTELERVVDADVEEFSQFFQSLGNEPLVRGEKAIIKTYLAWKLGVMKKD